MREAIPRESPPGVMSDERLQAAKRLTMIVYALQAVSFVLGITWIVAIIVNYVKKEDVNGTWLESHFRWQIRTFWFSLLWAALGFLFMLTIIGWFIGMFILMVNGVWIIYRIVKGWLRLNDGKEMYGH
jgi:uncharacterized membrane protein